jgi:nitrite transporter NirC
MTLLGIALLVPHTAPVAWSGFAANLIPVTLGNVVGGAGFVAGMYWFASPVRRFDRPAKVEALAPMAPPPMTEPAVLAPAGAAA